MNISSLQPLNLNTRYMRVAYGTIIASILLLAAISPSLLAAASDDETTCLGILTGDVDADLTVPSGTLCIITTGATIDGDVDVEPGGALQVDPGATIFGDIIATQPAPLIDVGSRSPDAVVIGPPFLGVTDDTPDEPATIMGDVVVKGSTGVVAIRHSIIGGDLVIKHTDGGFGVLININTNIIDGDIIIEDNEVECLCALFDNKVGGDVQVNNNIDVDDGIPGFDMDIIANTITGDLECEGNQPAPGLTNIFVDPVQSTVSGEIEGQCVGLGISSGDEDSD